MVGPYANSLLMMRVYVLSSRGPTSELRSKWHMQFVVGGASSWTMIVLSETSTEMVNSASQGSDFTVKLTFHLLVS